MKLKKPSLIVQIFSGMFLGIIIGHFWKDLAAPLSILSTIFMRLIKMIIAPLVFSVLVVGVAKVGDFKSVGRIGIKTLVYFTSAAIVALLVGLFLVNIFEPGKSMSIPLPQTAAETGINTSQKFDANSFMEHIIRKHCLRNGKK
jgi:Na+/H+-dicarboxylate symporter